MTPVNELELNEKSLFTNDTKTKEEPLNHGCCRSKHTKGCCIATGVFGGLFLVLGVVVMLSAGPMLEQMILKSMALIEGERTYESWLRPPVTAHMNAYAFNVKNPEAVMAGKKPILEEVGPFVYKSVTLKDSDDNIKFWPDGTLTYRQRKLYNHVPELSAQDPDKTFITVPNIPYWTGMHKAMKKSGIGKSIALGLIEGNGLNKPFINISFSGLLWGYNDELPCLAVGDPPKECASRAKESDDPFGSSDPFADSGDDDDFFGDDNDDGFGASDDDPWGEDNEQDSFGFDDEESEESIEALGDEVTDEEFKPPKDSEWESQVKPKAEFVDCQCEWGLFRDRNVTMREPIRLHSGVNDLNKKGIVTKYNGKTTHGWWKKGSECDRVKGQDSTTLPPGLTKDRELDIFIDLMCRTLKLKYEKDVEHDGINTLRFIPPVNALGRHDDDNEDLKNPDNECYCMENEGGSDNFRCLPSGAMYMEPCKRKNEAPLALSMPHFLNADPSYNDRISGLNPDPEKHQFYMDVMPEFGFPLAIRARFQLNILLNGDPDIPAIRNVPKDLVMPFLWAGLGFDEPSELMAKKVRFGKEAPEKLPLLGSVVFFVIGAILLLICLGYFLWMRRSASHNIKDSS